MQILSFFVGIIIAPTIYSPFACLSIFVGTKIFGEDMSTRVGRGVAAGEMPFEVLNPAARVCGIDASVGFTDSKGASLAWSAKRNFVKTKERSCDYLKSGKSGLLNAVNNS